MSTVASLLRTKGAQVFTISRDATVLDAAILMNEHKIGALVVCDDDQVQGIFTERDVLRRVVAARLDPATVKVGDVMTTDVIVCHPDCSIEDARQIFRSRRIRHLPVVNQQGKLEGMISIGDINAYKLDGQEVTIHYLEEFIYGRV